jgi:hypothetical protein
MYFAIKTLISALTIAGISELARRYSLLGAALASLPLTSILAFIWLYHDTKDAQKVAALSYDILWMVIPSLLFFIIFPLLIKYGMRFSWALALSCIIMSAAYAAWIYLKKHYME